VIPVAIDRVLAALHDARVEFILVGGVAAVAHGSARLTQDIDICYGRDGANLTRLADALATFEPYPRDAPAGLPFDWSAATLVRGLNFTLSTTLGAIDLLGELTGGGGYEQLRAHTITLTLFGCDTRVLDLETLIRVKRAAGRPKDYEAIAELELLSPDTPAPQALTLGEKPRRQP